MRENRGIVWRTEADPSIAPEGGQEEEEAQEARDEPPQDGPGAARVAVLGAVVRGRQSVPSSRSAPAAAHSSHLPRQGDLGDEIGAHGVVRGHDRDAEEGEWMGWVWRGQGGERQRGSHTHPPTPKHHAPLLVGVAFPPHHVHPAVHGVGGPHLLPPVAASRGRVLCVVRGGVWGDAATSLPHYTSNNHAPIPIPPKTPHLMLTRLNPQTGASRWSFSPFPTEGRGATTGMPRALFVTKGDRVSQEQEEKRLPTTQRIHPTQSTNAPQLRRVAHPREQQQLGRLDRPRADNHLGLGVVCREKERLETRGRVARVEILDARLGWWGVWVAGWDSTDRESQRQHPLTHAPRAWRQRGGACCGR